MVDPRRKEIGIDLDFPSSHHLSAPVGEEGVLNKVLYMGLRPEVTNPLLFYTPFLAEKVVPLYHS